MNSMKILIIALFVVMLTSFAVGFASLASYLSQKQMYTHLIGETHEEEMDDILALDVRLNADSLSFVSTTKPTLHLSYSGSVKSDDPDTEITITPQRKGNVLKIQKDRKEEREIQIFNFEEYYSEELNVEIHIPQAWVGELLLNTYADTVMVKGLNFSTLEVNNPSGETTLSNVDASHVECSTSSGVVTVKNLHSDEFRCKSYSGNLHFKQLGAEKITVTSTSGDITLETYGKTQELKMSTSSGDIVAKQLDSKQVECSSTSGFVKVKNSVLGRAECSSYSGDLDIEKTIFDELILDSSSGDIEVDATRLGDMDIKTTSGDVLLSTPSNSGFYLHYESYSGKLNNEFPIILKENSHDRIIGIVGNSSSTVKMKSSSGNLRITS